VEAAGAAAAGAGASFVDDIVQVVGFGGSKTGQENLGKAKANYSTLVSVDRYVVGRFCSAGACLSRVAKQVTIPD
jgi:hypothetical protein